MMNLGNCHWSLPIEWSVWAGPGRLTLKNEHFVPVTILRSGYTCVDKAINDAFRELLLVSANKMECVGLSWQLGTCKMRIFYP